MFGPLFQLQWLGLVCPCFQKEEDRNARQALGFVSGRRILWTKSAGNGSGFSLGKLFAFSSPSSTGNNKDNRTPSGPQRALLRLGDNDEGQPEIVVIPLGTAASDGDESDTIPSSAPSMELHIKLSRVDKVSLDGEEIVLMARPVKSSSSSNRTPPKELLRLSLLDASNGPVKQEERNLFMHHMAVLVEWERQRRDPYDDDDDDDDEPNFLQARAQKAKHFAQRELEMQTTKREREKRKAKFVAESGGLKYTALAMAGRSDSG